MFARTANYRPRQAPAKGPPRLIDIEFDPRRIQFMPRNYAQSYRTDSPQPLADMRMRTAVFPLQWEQIFSKAAYFRDVGRPFTLDRLPHGT